MFAPPRESLPALATLPLVIDTPRLQLRPYTLDDADAMFAFAKDPELPRQMSWAPHANITVTRAYLATVIEARDRNEGMVWAITTGGTYVGSIGLEGICSKMAAVRIDRAELGYWIGRPHRENGYMTEAARAVVSWGFTQLGLHKITVHAFVDNFASNRVIERVGFTLIGRKEADMWRDGQWHAQYAYELVRDEWKP